MTNKMIDLRKGDCLEVMKQIETGSVDAIITDPPYGTTACKWDSVIDFDLMWEQLNRIIKPNGAIVLFGSEPFSSALRMSNIKNYRYDWYWNKLHGANFMNGNRQPIKNIELASVFYKKQPPYNSQKTTNPKGVEKRSLYKPSKQKEFGKDQVGTREKRTKPSKQYEPDKLLAKCLIEFKRESKPIHPTQKPLKLMEYLIKTYTNENQTVLDFTMGSGTTGVSAKNLNRKFIGIEQDDKYFEIATERINKE